MDTSQDAVPNCPICHGKGTFTMRNDQGHYSYAICQCVLYTQRKRAAAARIERLFPGRMASMTLRNYNPGGNAKNEQALRVARNFVEDWDEACREGWIVGFWGEPRSGKTHLAHGIAIELVRRYLVLPHMLSVPRMLRMERERYNKPTGEDSQPSPILAAASADLLILDDLGAEYRRISSDKGAISWVDEQLFLILDERVNYNRPTIYTTNLKPSDLRTAFDSEGRVAGRLFGNQVVSLEVRPVPGENGPTDEARQRLLR